MGWVGLCLGGLHVGFWVRVVGMVYYCDFLFFDFGGVAECFGCIVLD